MTGGPNQTCQPRIEIIEEDLKAALHDLRTYVDISIDDLKALCSAAARHAEDRISRSLPVRDVMTPNVFTIEPNADIHEISKLLSEKDISGMPVVDNDGRVIGVVTEADVLAMTGMERGHTIRDLIRHLLREPVPGPREGGRASDFMSTPAVTIRPDADIREAATILNEKRIKRLPVVDEGGKLVGVISRADIVRTAGRQ
jgi:CBS domain-containing membrane protein